jgi:quinol monooxygenase YgiN
LEYSVFNDAEAPGTFLLYEKWTSSAALDVHNEQQHVKDFLVAAQEVMARDLRVHRLHPLSELPLPYLIPAVPVNEGA